MQMWKLYENVVLLIDHYPLDVWKQRLVEELTQNMEKDV